jgi:hypothetical protein
MGGYSWGCESDNDFLQSLNSIFILGSCLLVMDLLARIDENLGFTLYLLLLICHKFAILGFYKN